MSTTTIGFIPGWGSHADVWMPLIAQLRGTRPHCLLELPGEGDTPAPRGASLAEWADALASRLDGPSVLCGWSLGAMLAMQLALRHPALVEALVLIAPTPSFVARADWPHGLDAHTVDLFRSGFAADPAAIRRRFVALQALGDSRRRTVSKALEDAQPAATSQSEGCRADGLTVLAEADLRISSERLALPVRILHGANDALMPVGAAEWLADQLPQGRLSIFKDCGHAPFLSRPQECAALIGSFLDE